MESPANVSNAVAPVSASLLHSARSRFAHSDGLLPSFNLSLSGNSSFLNKCSLLDGSYNQSSSFADSGLEDSPFLHYRFRQSRDQFADDCSPVAASRTACCHSSEKAVPDDVSFTPPSRNIPSQSTTSNTNSQWTPETRQLEPRKRQLCKTYEELFPDSGISEVRCSSPIPGSQPPSPTFGCFTVKDLASLSPFASVDGLSPLCGSSLGSQLGHANDMYFSSSSNEQCVSLESESHLSVIGKETKVNGVESKDLKQDVETTRRSLFVDSCNKLSDNLTSTSELVHYTGMHQMNEKLPERKRRKSEGEPATETGRIGSVVSKSNDEEDLIGDFTKPCCLPRIASKHQDLKSISPQTLLDICNGRYSEVIKNYFVVDCRYPYEYQGGHIQGAKNIYTQEQLLSEFFPNELNVDEDGCQQRLVIIFHCEFSSERAPKLMRFMRNHDRALHADSYPALRYPELYLLEGGYQAFHGQFGGSCLPAFGYTPMFHREHSSDLRHFKTKSKSTPADQRKSRLNMRTTGKLFK